MYEETFAQSRCDLVSKVVDASATLNVPCRTFSLQMFCVVVKYLQHGGAWCLYCISPAKILAQAPPYGGSGQEGSQRSWIHGAGSLYREKQTDKFVAIDLLICSPVRSNAAFIASSKGRGLAVDKL